MVVPQQSPLPINIGCLSQAESKLDRGMVVLVLAVVVVVGIAYKRVTKHRAQKRVRMSSPEPSRGYAVRSIAYASGLFPG